MDKPVTADMFLAGHIDFAAFRHADHVRVGFQLLKTNDFSTALYKFSVGLKALAARAGTPDAYHQTITLAFLALIAERSAKGCFDNADEFLSSNPDVMDKTLLERWYTPDRLNSDIARRIFILPEAIR